MRHMIEGGSGTAGRFEIQDQGVRQHQLGLPDSFPRQEIIQGGNDAWPAVNGSIHILVPGNGSGIARNAAAASPARVKASAAGWQSRRIAITGVVQFMWNGCVNGARRIRNTGSGERRPSALQDVIGGLTCVC